MKFAIDSVDAIDSQTFLARYFDSERPVVVRSVALGWPARTRWTAEALRAELLASPSTKSPGRKLWLENTRAFLDDDLTIPPIVADALAPARTSGRTTDARFWIHRAGNVTHWHYDANALFVFNVQVRGRKEFTLVPPTTPLPSYPFASATSYRANARTAARCDHAIVVLEEGDLLFMPAFWQHRVRALTDTININWVGTRKAPPRPSATARRELEIVKLARTLPFLAGWISSQITAGASRSYFDEFGGSDGAVVRAAATRAISTPRAVLRGVREVAELARIACRGKRGRPMVKDALFG